MDDASGRSIDYAGAALVTGGLVALPEVAYPFPPQRAAANSMCS
jgi:hypothetical protein